MTTASATTAPTTGAAPDDRQLPVVVIGAGPVGLAAAAHLADRGLPAIVLDAGAGVGSAMTQWGHIRTFTPWQYIVDATAERILARSGWTRPTGRQSPTGAEIVEQYLRPLAEVLGDVVQLGARVEAVSRDGLDRSRSLGRDERPFVVRVHRADGTAEDLRARAVIDASGTWGQSNPLGASGLPALGEDRAGEQGFLVGPLPDVLGRDRGRFAGRTTLVVGMGHSAANTLVALTQLAREVPGTRVVWAIRGTSARRVFGGGTADQLPDRGRLGSDLADLVATGAVEHVVGFSTRELRVAADGRSVTVVGDTGDGERALDGVHNIVAATGFRPDLSMLSELRLDLDPGLEAPRAIGPLVDPAFHSCGSVPPHGWRELAHEAEPGFFVVGMKSYGRAPTFLITTGNEQVRSIVAHLAGDQKAADDVQLVLPETGVCSSSNALSDEQVTAGVEAEAACCGTSAAEPADAGVAASLERLRVGFATGVPNGRAGDAAAVGTGVPDALALVEVSTSRSGGCCG
jgi:thioredoxin reductase